MGDERDSYRFEVTVHDVLSLQQLKTLEDGECALPHIWDTVTLASHHGLQVRTVNYALISSDGESDSHWSAQCKAPISLESRNCTESKPETRSLFVPQEFKGNADVLPEHKGVLHVDHVVVIFWILVPQVLEDPPFLLPRSIITRSNITLFLRWCPSPRAMTSVFVYFPLDWSVRHTNVKAMVRRTRLMSST